MKIEKISDNQIRCTDADLADRQLQLSELAYGTEKAKSLFRDMMQQAAFEFGFRQAFLSPMGNPFRRFDRADNYKSRGSTRNSIPDFQNLHLLPLLMPGKRILRASWKEQKVYSICSERFSHCGK